MNAPALFLVPYPIETGYAIDSYVAMFLRAATRLNDGDASRVHFGFTATGGHSRTLPPDFDRIVRFDPRADSERERAELVRYVRANRIRFVMLLDVQPVSPLVRLLRDAGVELLISYWGAQISAPFAGPRLWLKRAGIRLAGRARVDSLIFESHAMAELAVIGRGCPASMLDVVPLGTNPARFQVHGGRAHIERTFGIGPDKTVILFSGHTHERKGIGTLLDAAVQLCGEGGREDLYFLLCGNRDGEADPWLQRIRGTAAEHAVRFAGYRSDMPLIMTGADIGVIPSSGWDSFTVSSLELAAAGLPVVVSRLGGLPEAIVEGETGLVFPPGDARALARCLADLADHPDKRRALGERGRERVRREYTLDAQEARLAAVFDRRFRAARRDRGPERPVLHDMQSAAQSANEVECA